MDTRTTEVMNQDRHTVTVWSDIGCPWATLALSTLRTHAGERGQALLVDHRAFPLELFNGRPTPKLIVDAEVVTIAGCRPEFGWKPWTAPEYTYPGIMLPAMEAVQACKDPAIGGLLGSDELDAALRRAFYADSRREVYEQWQVAKRPEVQGSPHVFTAGGLATHNPGVVYHWTASPPDGFPRLDEYHTEWADELLDALAGA